MINKDYLYHEYITNNKNATQISLEINKKKSEIYYWLKKHQIPTKPRGGRYNSVNLTGKVFGDLTAVKQIEGDGCSAVWECQCSCGNLHKVKGPPLRRGEIKSCGKCKEHFNWKGCGELSGRYFAIVEDGAKARNIIFNITIEYMWALFLKQNRICKLSGIKLFFSRSHKATEQTASLDRIDSSKGYVEGNVQWVHKDLNRMKWNISQKDFIEWCKKVTHYDS